MERGVGMRVAGCDGHWSPPQLFACGMTEPASSFQSILGIRFIGEIDEPGGDRFESAGGLRGVYGRTQRDARRPARRARATGDERRTVPAAADLQGRVAG